MKERIKSECHFDFHSLIDSVFQHRQDHIFQWWGELNDVQKNNLLSQINTFDFKLINDLVHTKIHSVHETSALSFEPAPIINLPETEKEKEACRKAKQIGEEQLKKSTVAVFVVAGGQGSRLGFDGPKGCFLITPIKKKSLFQTFAEQILALQKHHNSTLPFYIMTSETNHDQTFDFFKKHNFFGLNPENVFIFKQGMIPAVDKEGKFLLNSKHNIFTSPDGHGGSFLALKDNQAIEDMEKRGIKFVFYFQVDNVLVNIADPVFLGQHIMKDAELSCKVVEKKVPSEKVGIIGNVNGNIGLIEYTMLSEQDAAAKDSTGKLKFRAGNIAMHFFNFDFIKRLTDGEFSLPYNVQLKKIPHLNKEGTLIIPEESNAYKFETFIFDSAAHANHTIVVAADRKEEFSPVKNTYGADSPKTANTMQIEKFASWLEYAGIDVPKDQNKNILGKIEISPLFARDKKELKSKINNMKLNPGFELYLG